MYINPRGWLSDRYGGKWVLFYGVIGWSFFTFVVPLALRSGIALFILSRVLLGASEGVGFPAVHSLLGKWIPVVERSRSVAIVTAFSYLGAVLSSVIASALIEPFGWRSIFYSFGSIGLLWTFPWLYYGANEPQLGHRGLSEDEFESIAAIDSSHFYSTTKSENSSRASDELSDLDFELGELRSQRVPWKRILMAKEVWAIMINQFAQSWGFYTMLFYMPKYFEATYRLGSDMAGYMTIFPNLLQGVGGVFMGFAGDYLIHQRKLPTAQVRLGAQMLGMLGPAVFFGLLGYVGDKSLALAEVLVILALGTSTATLIGVSCSQLDIAPKYAGTVFALGNLSGTIAGMIGSLVAGQILDQVKVSQSWALLFNVCAGFNVLGAVSWWFMGGGNKVVID